MSSSEFDAGSKSPSAEDDVVDVGGELETNYMGGSSRKQQQKIPVVFVGFCFLQLLEIDFFWIFFWIAGKILWGSFGGLFSFRPTT